MKKIIAINASPRLNWNTAQLVKAAANGATLAGAEVEIISLRSLERYTGCVSCFGCKLEQNHCSCVYQDDITPILDKIRTADGLILGSPIYCSEATSSFRALYERLIFQHITYNKDNLINNDNRIPVLFIVTSNVPDSAYEAGGLYYNWLQQYKYTLSSVIGPTETLVAADTMQVHDYSRFNWTMFDTEAKIQRHDTVFPSQLKAAEAAGAKLVS